MNKSVDFLGIKLGALTSDEMVDKILEFALTGRYKMMTYINAHCVNIACSDLEYKEILRKMDLVYAGGMGVVWGARLFNGYLPERVNIMDFFDRLAERLKANKIRIYLLGAERDIVQRAKNELKARFSLEIVGCHSGFFDKKEEDDIIKEINVLKPNILMVGMGVPKQEKWIYDHLYEVDTNLCWAVGGVFDLLAGDLKRAPGWISNYGLEWLYLGLQRPKRLFKRYLFGNFIFACHILKCKLKRHYEKTS